MNTISGPVGTAVNPVIRLSNFLHCCHLEGKHATGLLSLIQKLDGKRSMFYGFISTAGGGTSHSAKEVELVIIIITLFI